MRVIVFLVWALGLGLTAWRYEAGIGFIIGFPSAAAMAIQAGYEVYREGGGE